MTSPAPPTRAAIVTGAARGIGRAIALRLAQDGYNVAANDLSIRSSELESLADEIKRKGRRVIIVFGDVSQEQDVQDLVDRTVAELGELYIMVANAGIGSPVAPVVDLSLQRWEQYIAINLTGVFLCYRAAARQMLKQGHGGRIVGAGSAFGKRAQGGASAYSTTKFGVRGLTQALATELAKEGITVNSYAPGFIDTPLLHGVVREGVSNHPQGAPIDSATQLKAMRNSAPMQRFGTPDNVAALVSYIVSKEADFMTGQSLSINGGLFYD